MITCTIQAQGLNLRHGKVVFLRKLDGKCKFVITIPAHEISRASSLNSVTSLVHSAAVTGRVDVLDATVTVPKRTAARREQLARDMS